MTDQEWLEEQERGIAEEETRAAKERWLAKCRRQRVVKQEQLAEIVKLREWLEDYCVRRKEELWLDGLRDYQEELEWDVAKLKAALGGGAEVEAGELTLEDALPQERQLKLAY
jgi:hypothetical protein